MAADAERLADPDLQRVAADSLPRVQELTEPTIVFIDDKEPVEQVVHGLIFDFVLDQYRPVFGDKRCIAIIGPANFGKSTLYNQLIWREEDLAEVGLVPGTTRQDQEADTGLFSVIDTPGADAMARCASGSPRPRATCPARYAPSPSPTCRPKGMTRAQPVAARTAPAPLPIPPT